ncbi:MAG: DUF4198 domain-containing protein [Granulosicoccus sp.]
MNKCRVILSALLLIVATGITHAHDFWIETDNFSPSRGENVAVSLHFGVGFDSNTFPYTQALIDDFSVTDERGRRTITSTQGSDPAAAIKATAGAQLLGYQSKPQFIELDAATFDVYVEEEGIEYIRAERERRGESKAPAAENFIRCAKALIQNGDSTQDIYRHKLGYTLELVPLSDPYKLRRGENIDFVVLYQGKPTEGLLVQALSKTNPQNVQKVRTNKSGIASVTMDEQGVWLIKVVLMTPLAKRQPLEGTKSASWQSYWATYVFEL